MRETRISRGIRITNSTDKYLWSTYNAPHIVLGAGGAALSCTALMVLRC